MDIFKPVMGAYQDGMKNLQDTLKVERDPQVRIYNKLKPADFQAIDKQYGTEATAQYIQAMESRRLKRRS